MRLTVKEYVNTPKDVRKDALVIKDFTSSITASDDRTATFIITTGTPDREQDIVVPKGISIEHYLKNKVVLWGHDQTILPIGKCIEIQPTDNGWQATVEFAPAEANPMAEQVYQLVKGGFLSAVSIGFIPLELELNDLGGYTITKSELFEFSIVNVPANPEALIIEEHKSINNTVKNSRRIKLLELYKTKFLETN
ncbi:HK97 family phage prohead protease [Acetobacter orientalis]|uniref:HK97 family phage prohead protease n=1 Tax=Acetobacter orientalis TaxID=146474 RepID=UPI0038639321